MRRILLTLLIGCPLGCVALSELDTLSVGDAADDAGTDVTTAALKDASTIAVEDGGIITPSDDSGVVITPGLELGESCAAEDAGCRSDLFCSSPFLAPTSCTSTCIRSEDCPTGFVCFASGRGGAFCMRGTGVGRDVLGATAGGAACDAGPNCRSGLCLGNKCIDNCSQDSQCAAGSRCRAAQLNGRYSFVCGPQAGNLATNAPCDAGDQCASSACVNSLCAQTCCAAKDCEKLPQKGCGHFIYDGDRIPICTPAGDKPPGATCNMAGQCASGHCDPVTLKCAVVCCIDSDCAPNEVCRPGPGEPYSLRCIPK